MQENYCFLCASAEGVLLDIYSDPEFLDKLESCFLDEQLDINQLPSKVCYKCAYEVNQCNEFVNKYKKAQKASRKKKSANTCCLCLEPGKKGKIFDLTKEKRTTNDPIQRILDIFDNDYSQSANLMMCLDCRYCLDVLHDLQKVFTKSNPKLRGSIAKEQKDMTPLVIKRKTVKNHQNPKSSSQVSSDSDSDNSCIVVSNKRSKNKLITLDEKKRKCPKCQSDVPKGADMFRYHRTGLTVCKSCWVKEDPGKTLERKRTQGKSTRRCAVFLKDVINNETDLYKVEKDKYGNITYIITDEGSESEDKPVSKKAAKISGLKSKKSKSSKSAPSDSKVESSDEEIAETLDTSKKSVVNSSENDENTKSRTRKRCNMDTVEVKILPSKRTRVSSTSSVGSVSSVPFKSPKENEGKNRRAKKTTTKAAKKTIEPINKEEEEESTNTLRKSTRKAVIKVETELKELMSKAKKGTKRVKTVEEATEVSKKKGRKSVKSKAESTKSNEEEVFVEENKVHRCKQCELEFENKADEIEHVLNTHSINMSLRLHRVQAKLKSDDKKEDEKTERSESSELVNDIETLKDVENDVDVNNVTAEATEETEKVDEESTNESANKEDIEKTPSLADVELTQILEDDSKEKTSLDNESLDQNDKTESNAVEDKSKEENEETEAKLKENSIEQKLIDENNEPKNEEKTVDEEEKINSDKENLDGEEKDKTEKIVIEDTGSEKKNEEINDEQVIESTENNMSNNDAEELAEDLLEVDKQQTEELNDKSNKNNETVSDNGDKIPQTQVESNEEVVASDVSKSLDENVEIHQNKVISDNVENTIHCNETPVNGCSISQDVTEGAISDKINSADMPSLDIFAEDSEITN